MTDLDVRWVKIKSFHVVRLTSRGGLVGTLCGRWLPADTPIAEYLDQNEKSCETCARLALKDA